MRRSWPLMRARSSRIAIRSRTRLLQCARTYRSGAHRRSDRRALAELCRPESLSYRHRPVTRDLTRSMGGPLRRKALRTAANPHSRADRLHCKRAGGSLRYATRTRRVPSSHRAGGRICRSSRATTSPRWSAIEFIRRLRAEDTAVFPEYPKLRPLCRRVCAVRPRGRRDDLCGRYEYRPSGGLYAIASAEHFKPGES